MPVEMPWTIPVVQATLGSCDSPALAAAVSEAGALGTLSFHALAPDEAVERLSKLASLTQKTVLIAFTGPWEQEEVLDACIEAGHRYFQVFWWNAPRLVPRIRAVGAFAIQQVGTLSQLNDALERDVDGIVAQGTRAGGPVRSPLSLGELISAVRTQFSGSLIAGGGLATREDVHEVLALGADAALLGTRFLLSEEAIAPQEHKSALVAAHSMDLLLDTRLIGDWPCAPRRRLPLPGYDHGTSSLEAGLGLDQINDVLPAAELVRLLNPR
ncbi:MAG: nitronate monooxygenase [Armatimonas sp.]